VSCQVGETEGVVGKRGRGVSLFGWGEKVKRWREGIEKVLLAAIDILYSRGGRVGYYRVSGGGGVDAGLGDGREWGCGWAELSKCSSAVHQQQQLKNARTRNEKVFGERV